MASMPLGGNVTANLRGLKTSTRKVETDELARFRAEARAADAEELVETLQGLGVPAMAVMNIEDQFIDPHWQEREAYAEIEHPHIGIEWIYGMPWLLSATPGSVRTAGS